MHTGVDAGVGKALVRAVRPVTQITAPHPGVTVEGLRCGRCLGAHDEHLAQLAVDDGADVLVVQVGIEAAFAPARASLGRCPGVDAVERVAVELLVPGRWVGRWIRWRELGGRGQQLVVFLHRHRHRQHRDRQAGTGRFVGPFVGHVDAVQDDLLARCWTILGRVEFVARLAQQVHAGGLLRFGKAIDYFKAVVAVRGTAVGAGQVGIDRAGLGLDQVIGHRLDRSAGLVVTDEGHVARMREPAFDRQPGALRHGERRSPVVGRSIRIGDVQIGVGAGGAARPEAAARTRNRVLAGGNCLGCVGGHLFRWNDLGRYRPDQGDGANG